MDVIILNGSSSSGKSSIAKQLQSCLSNNYLHLGIDTFITMMPKRCNTLSEPDKVSDGFYWETENYNEEHILRIRSGDYGKLVNKAYQSTVKHLVNIGLRVIVDDVMNGEHEQKEWVKILGESSYLFVGVTCNESELIRREKSRKNRINNSAIEQANRVHKGVLYELTVSTSEMSSNNCAQQIASHITNKIHSKTK